uniref:Uncharacterized protein AlNc14C573G12190 n=1 Tax=Albugo laibachii Nc14 TaxID=890382 RepID=F0X195_9STRA|nr:conserved hypothetical protein [Albugo laibachii Nc14]|eukprot:CCA27555.1 conserved hypothetical protein [Albugo laibachii Nc14]
MTAQALLKQIADYEKRGAISSLDAHTLRNQVTQCSTSAECNAVRVRLDRLAVTWNPYQNSTFRTNGTSVRVKRSKKSTVSPTIRRNLSSKRSVRTCYDLLGINQGDKATPQEIKRHFRQLALLYHPDKKHRIQAVDTSVKQIIDFSDSEQKEGIEEDDTHFAQLLAAYETLSDPIKREHYDARISSARISHPYDSVDVKDQIQIEADTKFASLEWMKRVQYKMDVMDRIAAWAQMLSINPNEIRFETGKECFGDGCGKIVSMDRDLEYYGSTRRRVYVCLYHKYIHACDATCTSHDLESEQQTFDERVCPVRAYWLVQSWIHEHSQYNENGSVESSRNNNARDTYQNCDDDEDVACETDNAYSSPGSPQRETTFFNECTIKLGTATTPFSLKCKTECCLTTCRGSFQYLDSGIYVCRNHGTPHICSYEQCNRQLINLSELRYVCWISGRVYGQPSEEAGTLTRKRRLMYSGHDRMSLSVEMDVPLLLPLGEPIGFLLENSSTDGNPCNSDRRGRKHRVITVRGRAANRRSSSQIRQSKRARTAADYLTEHGSISNSTSPNQMRRQRLVDKVEAAETVAKFNLYIQVPPVVANFPRVALEMQELSQSGAQSSLSASTEGNNSDRDRDNSLNILLLLVVKPQDTVNTIKYWIEELTEQQLTIWDQQLYWGDTLIGEEDYVLTLDEHGLRNGCVIELRLHDDCPILVGSSDATAVVSANAGISRHQEYNTIQISKEAEEDLEDQLEEDWYTANNEQCESLQSALLNETISPPESSESIEIMKISPHLLVPSNQSDQ